MMELSYVPPHLMIGNDDNSNGSNDDDEQPYPTVPDGGKRGQLRARLSVRKMSVRGLLRGKSTLSMKLNKQVGLVPFKSLAKQRRFDEIMSMLAERDSCNMAKWLNDCASAHGSPALHTVLLYRPPVQLVQLLCQKLTELGQLCVPEDAVDNAGKTPLHIAVASGCGIDVIKLLLNGTAATVMDNSKRCPLHWACTNPNGTFSFRPTKKKIEEMQAIVMVLIKAYPHARTIRDKNGHSPFQIAQKAKANQSVLCALHPGIDSSTTLKDSATSTDMTDDVPREVIRDDSEGEISAMFSVVEGYRMANQLPKKEIEASVVEDLFIEEDSLYLSDDEGSEESEEALFFSDDEESEEAYQCDEIGRLHASQETGLFGEEYIHSIVPEVSAATKPFVERETVLRNNIVPEGSATTEPSVEKETVQRNDENAAAKAVEKRARAERRSKRRAMKTMLSARVKTSEEKYQAVEV